MGDLMEKAKPFSCFRCGGVVQTGQDLQAHASLESCMAHLSSRVQVLEHRLAELEKPRGPSGIGVVFRGTGG